MSERFETWGKTHRATPAAWAMPADEAEVADVVRRAAAAGQGVRVVGAGHSWSDCVVTDGVIVRLDRLDQLLQVDEQRGLATAQAGMRLRAFNAALHARGYAISIVGSIDQQSLGGLVATATHGSSLVHGNLSSFIVAMRIVTATGDVLVLDEGDPRLPAARVSLGALGVVTQLTLRVERAFQVAEVSTPVTFDAGVQALATMAGEHEWAKLWWLPHTDAALLVRARRSDGPATFSPRHRAIDERVVNAHVFKWLLALGSAVPALIPMLNRVVAAAYFTARTVVGRSDLVLSMAMPPVHRESEWAVPAEHAADVMRRLRAAIVAQGLRVNFIVEARYVKGDSNWMSPAYGRDTVQIGAYVGGSPDCDAYYAAIARIVAEHGGRPHWGKEAAFDAALIRRVLPMADAFAGLVREVDPDGVFRNPFVRRVIGE
ncbi:MAG: D-arabinono-1,4-lactone oxidase [Pseudomonadota bacterium]|nr:D-arabinono-1,4-lactone oxidase [Pseudomonadota bacterium]